MSLIAKDYDPFTGMTTEYFSRGGKLTIRRSQDVEPYLVQNQQELNARSSKARVGIASGVGVKVASIPPALVEKWLKEEGFNIFTASEVEIARKLNDPDYRKLRTAHGRV
jgi:hypothetical protein